MGERYSMSESLVRLGRSDDGETLARLAHDFHTEDGHPIGEAAVSALLAMLAPDNAHGRVLIVEQAGAVIGYAALCFGYSVEYGGRDAFVDDIYVVPSARGRGHGARLYAALEGEAALRGCRALHLELMTGNRMEEWYRSLGYSGRSRLLTKRLAAG
jgi:GNAT superfamily N-acetyltransferase